MKRLLFVLLATLAVPPICLAGAGTGLPEAHRSALLKVSRWHEVRAVAKLPSAIAALLSDEEGKIADPGQPWNPDCTPHQHLPRHRLGWAVTAGKYYVVQYEAGGYAPYRYVLIATLPQPTRQSLVVWRGGDSDAFKDYREFLAALKNGDLERRLKPVRYR